MPRVFTIDGRDFSTLEGFFEATGALLVPGQSWGKNLDAFNDLLCWPLDEGEPYHLLWKNSALSRKRLGYLETQRQIQKRLTTCPTSFQAQVAEELEKACRSEGPTVFVWLVEIIQSHPDWVTLHLE